MEEGNEEHILCLMNETGKLFLFISFYSINTGPITEKLQGNLSDNLISRIQFRLFDEEGRFIILDWIERALFSRAPLSKPTLAALQKTLKQLIEYQKDSQEKDRIVKMLEYTTFVLEKSRGTEEKRDTERKKIGSKIIFNH